MRRIQPRYVVSVYQWNPSERCYARTARYVGYGSITGARLRADTEASLLPVAETTWALRSYARSGWVNVTTERSTRTVYHAPARTQYVPSIGERGY